MYFFITVTPKLLVTVGFFFSFCYGWNSVAAMLPTVIAAAKLQGEKATTLLKLHRNVAGSWSAHAVKCHLQERAQQEASVVFFNL